MPFERTPIAFDQLYLLNRADDIERVLILAILKSFRFYRQISKRLCPRINAGPLLMYRPDFTVEEYNKAYALAAGFWEAMAPRMVAADMSIQWDWLEIFLSNEMKKGVLTLEAAQAVKSKLQEDMVTTTIEPELLRGLSSQPVVCAWLGQRAAAYELRRLTPAVLGREPTDTDFEQARKNIAQSKADMSTQVVSVPEILNSRKTYSLPFKLPIKGLNELIGGGIRSGQTTVFGAISGGGKTVFATQTTSDLAYSGHNVLFLTTEQPPEQLLTRMLSDRLNIHAEMFHKRVERAANGNIAGIELDFIPVECWGTTQESWLAMEHFCNVATEHIKFIDWSNGQRSLVTDFDDAVSQVMDINPGWEPKVIVIDWVGGGLNVSGDKKDSLRLFYKEAGDVIVNYGKRYKRAMLEFAQLNKTLVSPRTANITMDMMAECKSLMDNAWNFLGVTSMRAPKDDESTTRRLNQVQWICVDKAREGAGGRVKVLVDFEHQRFSAPHPTMSSHAA